MVAPVSTTTGKTEPQISKYAVNKQDCEFIDPKVDRLNGTGAEFSLNGRDSV